jgi:hypothetical protein
MRSTLVFAASVGALMLAGQAFAAAPMSGPAPGSTMPDTTTTTGAPSSTPSTAPSTPPAATGPGANSSATVSGLTVGMPVKDNTGATIGEIASLGADAGGNQTAVIKMGSDQFQVQTDKLGSSNGAATINLTQAQIATMLHGKTGGAAAPGNTTTP